MRTPRDLAELRGWLPDVHEQLMEILRTLERHYGDMQDTEFTVQEGRLYMLQTRNAKRPAQAAVRFAVDAVAEGLLEREAALLTIDPSALDALLHPTFDPSAEYEVIATGVAASPGAAKGEIVLSAAEAVRAASEGRDVILVRSFTEADDVAGFHAARGILTSEGGKASHAALVARGMGRPAVTGASAVEVDLDAGEVRVGGRVLRRGRHDRDRRQPSGRITTEDVPLVEPQVSSSSRRCSRGATSCAPWACAPTRTRPATSPRRSSWAPRAIGLCRTEHMFLGERQPLMAAVIMAEDDQERAPRDRAAAPPAGGATSSRSSSAADGTAGDGAPAGPAAARVPAPPRGAARGLAAAQARRAAAGVKPDARHARRAPRHPVPGAV